MSINPTNHFDRFDFSFGRVADGSPVTFYSVTSRSAEFSEQLGFEANPVYILAVHQELGRRVAFVRSSSQCILIPQQNGFKPELGDS